MFHGYVQKPILRQENGESLKELYTNRNILEEREIRLELVRM